MSERYFDRDGVYDIVINDYVSTSAIVYKLNKISDIEAKLAESEKEIKEWIAVRDDKNNVINKQTEKINQLKQQLTEKDKQLEKLKSENHALMSDNAYQEADMFEFNSRIEQLQKQLAEKEDALETHKRAIQRMNRNCDTTMCRNKISFAVEQLERLKHDIWTDQQDDGWLDEKVDIYFLTETIDNQIKRLTHQHGDKGE